MNNQAIYISNHLHKQIIPSDTKIYKIILFSIQKEILLKVYWQVQNLIKVYLPSTYQLILMVATSVLIYQNKFNLILLL